MKENAIEWITGEEWFTFTLSQKKHINKMLKLKEKQPDLVEIKKMPEENHGYLYGHAHLSLVKLSPKRVLSDETRKLSSERLKRLIDSKNAT